MKSGGTEICRIGIKRLRIYLVCSYLRNITFQKKAPILRSGWDLYRQENKSKIEEEGFSGKNIMSKLGENWRSLKPEERNKYRRKSYVLMNMNVSSPKLMRSKSCCKDVNSSVMIESQKSL